MRDNLFPELRDLVDPKTNAVLLKGQQFHNLITSPTYLKRRKYGNIVRTQVEIPFALWATDRGSSGGAIPRFLLDPLECNHTLGGEVATSLGTIGVHFEGTNLKPAGKTPEYVLERGDTDYMLDCRSEAMNVYTVGWSNESDYGQLLSPPVFYTQSNRSTACVTKSPLDDPTCFITFARDRSLAAPDWKLVIPLYYDEDVDSDQGWLLGNGVSNKPVIEDVVLYLRHHKRRRLF
ncbi:MAG TPA: hypothetical protein VKP30_08395, partial [Polyangiaceae bacterium]|nr:hypothetical protein [Polyangiaceae bacterium]